MYEKFACISRHRDTSLEAAAYRSGVTMEGRLMSTSKLLTRAAVLIVVAGLAMSHVTAQSGYDLFQKALAAERADGNMQQVIQLYERIAKEFAADRALAAKALLRLGDCYQKVGEAKAQAVFEQVVRQFADQTDAAAEARARLAAFTRAPARSGGIVTRQVWKDKDVDTTGTISADGRYLSFTDWTTGDLAVRDLATGSNRRLTNKGTWAESEDYAELSVMRPDGRQVAYAWYSEDRDRYDLRMVDISTDKPSPSILYENVDVDWIAPMDWSADGRWIAVELGREDRSAQIGLVSAADGSLRVLKSVDWRNSTDLVFSPDSRYLAFDLPHGDRSQQRDVFVMAIDGSREVPVVVDRADNSVVAWTPDGKRLLFVSDRRGSTDLWAIAIDEGRPREDASLVKSDFGRQIGVGTTRTGALYFGVLPGGFALYTASVDFQAGKVLTRAAPLSGPAARQPDWSPDGRYLAYQVRRRSQRGTPVLAVRSEATGDVRELRLDLNYFQWPRWAPDGRSLIVSGQDRKARPGMYRIDAQTGAVAPLMQSLPGTGQLAEWLPDGKRIIYRRIDSALKESVIVERDLDSGREREVFRRRDGIDPRFIAVSPDGRHLAFAAANRAAKTSGLFVVPLEGGPLRELLQVAVPQQLTWPSWTRDGRSVLFRKDLSTESETASEMWMIPFDGGRARKLDFGLGGIRGVRAHPNGNQVVFFRPSEISGELWVDGEPRRPAEQPPLNHGGPSAAEHVRVSRRAGSRRLRPASNSTHHHSVLTPGYFAMFPSEVRTVSVLACASATSTRSNGSR
jgi:Tol biopolymer transport system component